jgi:BASS family bile acid:Na+ symporter
MPVAIDDVRLSFSPAALNVLNIILGFVVFGVSLGIKTKDFKVLVQSPKPFLVGVISQFVLFPAFAFLVVLIAKPQPSIALGIILVAACPGGNISNFMTQHARGNVPLSIAMSSFSTAIATIMTPLNVAFYGGQLAGTSSLMQDISLDPIKMFYLILVLMLLPLTLGIIISNKYPVFAAKLKKFMTAFSLIFFGFFLIFAIASNLKYFQHFKGIVCLSVIFLNLMAYLIGYAFAKLVGVSEENRRAVSIETGIQNSGLGLILIFNFFDGLGGMALICSLLGNLAYFLRPFIIHLLV